MTSTSTGKGLRASSLTHALLPFISFCRISQDNLNWFTQANGLRILGQVSPLSKGEGKMLCTFRMKASRTLGRKALSSKGVSLICNSIFSKWCGQAERISFHQLTPISRNGSWKSPWCSPCPWGFLPLGKVHISNFWSYRVSRNLSFH